MDGVNTKFPERLYTIVNWTELRLSLCCFWYNWSKHHVKNVKHAREKIDKRNTNNKKQRERDRQRKRSMWPVVTNPEVNGTQQALPGNLLTCPENMSGWSLKLTACHTTSQLWSRRGIGNWKFNIASYCLSKSWSVKCPNRRHWFCQ